MRVIEINDMLYKIADRDYTFIKEEVEKYLLREESKGAIKQIIDRVIHYNKPAVADLSIKEINEGEYGIKFNEQKIEISKSQEEYKDEIIIDGIVF